MLLKRFFAVLLIFTAVYFACSAQDVKFTMPLKGVSGKDFFICHYVDHDTTSGLQDAYCGKKTYNGHKGTDFFIRGFKAMDSGVYIYAVADGRVYATKDGNYDRMKKLDRTAPPNEIRILHKNKLRTYYLHLMKNSLLVSPGDSVKAGQPIAKVGSSGFTISPHLHFEVVDSNKQIIDPFSDRCSSLPSLWISEPEYDTSVFLITDGFTHFVPVEDSLKEGYKDKYKTSDVFSISRDSTICYWALIHGIRSWDKLTSAWIMPDGKQFTTFSYSWEPVWVQWYSYTWPHIRVPQSIGIWLTKLYVNDRLVSTHSFFVEK